MRARSPAERARIRRRYSRGRTSAFDLRVELLLGQRRAERRVRGEPPARAAFAVCLQLLLEHLQRRRELAALLQDLPRSLEVRALPFEVVAVQLRTHAAAYRNSPRNAESPDWRGFRR